MYGWVGSSLCHIADDRYGDGGDGSGAAAFLYAVSAGSHRGGTAVPFDVHFLFPESHGWFC